MVVVLVGIDLLPILVPVIQLNSLIIRATQHVWQSGVDCHRSDEIGVFFDCFKFLARIVVVHADLRVVRRYDNPLFANDELGSPDGRV